MMDNPYDRAQAQLRLTQAIEKALEQLAIAKLTGDDESVSRVFEHLDPVAKIHLLKSAHEEWHNALDGVVATLIFFDQKDLAEQVMELGQRLCATFKDIHEDLTPALRERVRSNFAPWDPDAAAGSAASAPPAIEQVPTLSSGDAEAADRLLRQVFGGSAA